MNNNFQYSAIGDNTPENREHLEKLGYKQHGDYRKHNDFIFAFEATDRCMAMYRSLYEHEIEIFYKDEFNCIGNSALFQAVTALRDDSDKDQIFVADANIEYHLAFPDGEPFFGKIEKGECFIMDKAMMHADIMDEESFIQDLSHKATLAEIKEHFKK